MTGPHQVPQRPGSLTVPRDLLSGRNIAHQVARQWQCISESELVQLDEDVLQRLSRSLHVVRDVSVPAAARVTQNSQEECHRSLTS